MIVTDRYAVYLFVDDTQRQICLAHLARDLVALGERDGAPGRLGREVARELGAVFSVLHDKDRDPGELPKQTAAHRDAFHDLLTAGTRCRDPKTRRFCEGLLGARDRTVDLHPRSRRPGHEQRVRACAQTCRSLAPHQLRDADRHRKPNC